MNSKIIGNQNYTHQQLVSMLTKNGAAICREMTPGTAHLVHMVLGISGEAGELLDAIKKHVIYQKPLDLENVIEELGDIEFYLEGLRSSLGISREACIAHNMNKLQIRYDNSTYSDQAAQDRADKA